MNMTATGVVSMKMEEEKRGTGTDESPCDTGRFHSRFDTSLDMDSLRRDEDDRSRVKEGWAQLGDDIEHTRPRVSH